MVNSVEPELSHHLNQCCANCNRKLFGFLHAPRHQCRMCGDLFCDRCTNQKALIPPSSIALVPNKPLINTNATHLSPRLNFSPSASQRVNASPRLNDSPQENGNPEQQQTKRISFQGNFHPINAIPENDDGVGDLSYTDESLSEEDEFMKGLVYSQRISVKRFPPEDSDKVDDFLSSDLSLESSPLSNDISYANASSRSQLHMPSSMPLYGQGLEERMKLAREPLRVCKECHSSLQHLQEELRNSNSNAVRYNSIDPTGLRRLVNSPMAFTLGHEIRKAAYTLSNLLPMPKRLGAFESFDNFGKAGGRADGDCKGCRNFIGNFSNVDGVRIPARLLEKAKGVAFLTVIKGGMGITGFEFGTGLVVSRLPDETWSPPCAIGTAGICWGFLVGIALSDHVLLLMTDDAVNVMSSNEGSVRLGADVGVALGPIGRTVEANVASGGSGGGVVVAPIYSYSFSKGFYVGASVDGKIIVTRHEVNEKFYGHKVDARALLSGEVPTPPAAQPLYDALKRCHVHARSFS